MKLTKAMKKIISQRDAKHPGDLKVNDKNSTAVVYIGENAQGKPTGVFYTGRRKKPNQAFYYRSREQLRLAVDRFFESQAKIEELRKPNKRALKVGDVLVSCWGYDQTNIDYYQVTDLVGKTMVEITEIASERSHDGQDHGECSPMLDKFISEPMRRKCDGERVNITSYRGANLMKPKLVTDDGLKIYGTHSWSAWH